MMKKQTRKKRTASTKVNAKPNLEVTKTGPAPIGHNLAPVEEKPDELETLRDILVGPTQDLTVKRLEELVVILEERDEDLNRREADVRSQIAAVQTDLTEREQSLTRRAALLEKQLDEREAALYQKIETVEEFLAEREQAVAGKFEELDSQLNNCRAMASQIDMDLIASISIARKQSERRIRDVGNAIASLGSQIAEMCETSRSEAAE